ncbi:MAG: SRPBCC domain-containing protein [Ilumatobacteraceae bacterium]
MFRAHTGQSQFVQWMGPRGTTCQVDRFEAATGGAFRYTIGAGSATFTFFGSYHEVVSPSRIVHTWEFEGDPGRPTLESLTFVDLADGHCRLEGLSVYTSPEQCNEMFEFDQSGQGMDENFDRLDELITSL